MNLLESIFYMMWRGFAIGILISAPMGPVGILCIQRTLDRGRRTGLFTGIGAAISDLLYCLLTGFGLSFIEEFLERNHSIIQLAGSVVLIGFSVYLFKKNPANSLKTPMQASVSDKRNILYGFLFTVSNPLIIFLIIGLFARFNFMMPEFSFWHYICGFIFIFGGALFWWWAVTLFIDKVRAHFNLRSMFLINKIIGGIILLFAIVGIASSVIDLTSAPASARTIHLNRARGYAPFAGSDSLGLTIKPGVSAPGNAGQWRSENIGTLPFEFKCRGASREAWTLVLGDSPTGGQLRIRIASEESRHIISSKRQLHLSAEISFPDTAILVASAIVDSDADASGAPNSLRIVRGENNDFSVSIGRRRLNQVMTFRLPDISFNGFGFEAPGKKDARISDISLNISDNAPEFACGYTELEALLRDVSESSDFTEGVYRMVDASFDTSLMNRGGFYTLALKRNGSHYNIIYVDGAEIATSAWVPGMIKGRLMPTPFKDIFDVEWLDASFIPVSRGVTAQRADNLLTFQFPYQLCTLRFSKMPFSSLTRLPDR